MSTSDTDIPIIALVAGETSGDMLGAGLIQALLERWPNARFVGVGGPRMIEAGLESWAPMERLAVMGLVEPLKRLPELLRLRRDLRTRLLALRPTAFIGIDSPDFTMPLERSLREGGIPVLHYVSPSVWAWRRGRLRSIRRAVDCMLTLFPFEARFYEDENIPVRFVGHPLADRLDGQANQTLARQALGCEGGGPWVALLPGSRAGEVRHMGSLFLETALWCLERRPEWRFMLPAASPERLQELQLLLAPYADRLQAAAGGVQPLRLVDGQSQLVMTAADSVLMASGTTTLEALLLRRPMVVAYRMAALSWWILSRLVKVPSVSLPNLLAGRPLVAELLQQAATPEALGQALFAIQDDEYRRAATLAVFEQLHGQLRCDASQRAADAVLETVARCRA